MRLRLLISTVFVTTALFGATAGTAPAIVDGELDEANTYSYVGFVRVPWPNHPAGPRMNNCTGTLVAPDLVVTAAHCFLFSGSTRDALFTLDSPFVFTTPLVHGTATVHPGFDPNTETGFTADVAVIKLDAPYAGARRFAKVAKVDTAKLRGRGHRLRSVGYGLTSFDPTIPPPANGNAFPPVFRHTAKIGYEASPSASHLLLQRGPCFGDSGGPNLKGRDIVAITSFALSPDCSGPAFGYRLDTREAQEFLAAQGVPLRGKGRDDDRGKGRGGDDDDRGKGRGDDEDRRYGDDDRDGEDD